MGDIRYGYSGLLEDCKTFGIRIREQLVQIVEALSGNDQSTGCQWFEEEGQS
jgi:hypothetical protein